MRAGVLVVMALLTAAAASDEGPRMMAPPMPEGNRGDVLEELETARAAFEAERGDEARFAYAELLTKAGFFEKARKVLAPPVDVADVSLDALGLAARLAYYVGDYDESERLYRAMRERDPENARALNGLAMTYYHTNRFADAASLVDGAGGEGRLPHLDLMAAFGDAAPYEIRWAGSELSEVPFVSVDPLPIVEVEIDGRKVAALIDTGADVFVLDTEIAAELGIEPVVSMMGMFAGGKQAEISFGRATSLALGDVELREVPVMMLPTKPLSLGGVEVGGIVGTGVLKQFLATMDCPNAQLVLRPRGTPASELPGRVVENVPFYLEGTHFILTHGSLNEYGELLFLVDSGLAGIPAFGASKQTLEYVGIPIPETKVRDDVVGGGGGGFAVGEFEIAELGLGELRQTELIGSFGGQPPGSYWRRGFITDGLISHNFLKAYAWTLDFDGMRMVFTQ